MDVHAGAPEDGARLGPARPLLVGFRVTSLPPEAGMLFAGAAPSSPVHAAGARGPQLWKGAGARDREGAEDMGAPCSSGSGVEAGPGGVRELFELGLHVFLPSKVIRAAWERAKGAEEGGGGAGLEELESEVQSELKSADREPRPPRRRWGPLGWLQWLVRL